MLFLTYLFSGINVANILHSLTTITVVEIKKLLK